MMPILAKGDYVESKTKVNARHGRLRSQWVKSLKRNNTVIYGKDSISYFTLRLEKISNKDSLVFLGNKIQVLSCEDEIACQESGLGGSGKRRKVVLKKFEKLHLFKTIPLDEITHL